MSAEAVNSQWYPVDMASRSDPSPVGSRCCSASRSGSIVMPTRTVTVENGAGAKLETVVRFGHVWACPGTPAAPLYTIPEAEHPDRRLVDVGVVRVKCSPLRAVENFLDIAHFPFVHTDILGAEPHTEVGKY